MLNFDSKNSYGFLDLCALVSLLRSPEGCPWDGVQTHQSIRRNFLEEAYEACEAMDENDGAHLCEELGDVLLQVVFHTDIENDAGRFSMDDVCDGVCKKLIRRHPHIFSDVTVSGTDQVLSNWEEIKKQERGITDDASVLDSVARSLPALWRADKLQRKAEGFGFGLSEERTVAKLRNDCDAAAGLDKTAVGDLLFSAVRVAALAGVDPEDALNEACERFIGDFRKAGK